MTEKRYCGEFDSQYSGVYDNGKQLTNFEVVDVLNDLYEEVMDLRRENTNFKLVVGEIIKDMQKYVDDDQLVYINQSYVDWIKENVDTTLYSQKGDVE
ncbi:MAG: hypothetical protein IJ287_03190 [Methanobrevibacter sp.]|nr:hypothetical protein [Methanobrevibacter sp.]MBR1748884.1 hypothetical protein [Bacilli bacterium]